MESRAYSSSSKLKVWKILSTKYGKPKWNFGENRLEKQNVWCFLHTRWHASKIIDPINNYPSRVHLRFTTLTTRSSRYGQRRIWHSSTQCYHVSILTELRSEPLNATLFKIYPWKKHDMPAHRYGERSFPVKRKRKTTSSSFHSKYVKINILDFKSKEYSQKKKTVRKTINKFQIENNYFGRESKCGIKKIVTVKWFIETRFAQIAFQESLTTSKTQQQQ